MWSLSQSRMQPHLVLPDIIYFPRDGICILLKCPKFEHFQFLSLFCSNSHHVFLMTDFHMFVYIEMPDFRITLEAFEQNGSKIGH